MACRAFTYNINGNNGNHGLPRYARNDTLCRHCEEQRDAAIQPKQKATLNSHCERNEAMHSF